MIDTLPNKRKNRQTKEQTWHSTWVLLVIAVAVVVFYANNEFDADDILWINTLGRKEEQSDFGRRNKYKYRGGGVVCCYIYEMELQTVEGTSCCWSLSTLPSPVWLTGEVERERQRKKGDVYIMYITHTNSPTIKRKHGWRCIWTAFFFFFFFLYII